MCSRETDDQQGGVSPAMKRQRTTRASLALLLFLVAAIGAACTPAAGATPVPPAASTVPTLPSAAPSAAPAASPGASDAGKGSY
jgi:hypothetical protein